MNKSLSERALVFAPHGRDAEVACGMLAEAGFDADIVRSIPALVAELRGGSGLAVVTEEALHTADLHPLAEWINGQPEWSDFPFVLLTARGGGLERNPAARRFLEILGNVTFLERPFHPTTFVSLAESALRGRRRQYEARARLEALRESEKQAREAAEQLAEESHTLETLNRTGAELAAVLDRSEAVQRVTDAGVLLTGAQFGAFFHNVLDEDGKSYTLYALSGVDRSAFDKFPMPRATAIFEPTFVGSGIVRSDDITGDERYGRNAPYKGMPEGHLPVRSYLAVPVRSRFGGVIGGLFFGHEEPARFTERHAQLMIGLAGQAAIALENADLFRAAERELEVRSRTETELRAAEAALLRLNSTLENRVAAEVAEREEAESQLRQAQKMDAIGQLTGGVAHDFNNLLTPIMGGLDMLRQRFEDDHKAQRTIGIALQATARASTLVQRLLAFARRQDLQPRPVNVGELLSGMEELITRSIGAQIRVELDAPEGLPPALVDPNQLELAILNLAINARDAMPGGGRMRIAASEGTIERDSDDLQAGRYVRLAVADEGFGMDEETLRRASEPFFSTKGQGKGTGLGLSMVHGLAAQSGGALRIASAAGAGTTAEIWLPLATGEASRPAAAAPRPAIAHGGGTVLLVDDEDLVRSGTAEMLQEFGYRVVEAGSGAEALAVLRGEGERVDALVTDFLMPGMNGAMLAAEARALLPDLPVLLITGYSNIAEGPGADLPRLTKPFRQSELASQVARLMASRERKPARAAG